MLYVAGIGIEDGHKYQIEVSGVRFRVSGKGNSEKILENTKLTNRNDTGV